MRTWASRDGDGWMHSCLSGSEKQNFKIKSKHPLIQQYLTENEYISLWSISVSLWEMQSFIHAGSTREPVKLITALNEVGAR